MKAETNPGLLVSYFYLKQFTGSQRFYSYRDWVMDSGAFSAHASGVDIRLGDYIDCCKRVRASDVTLSEVFALDVIGDWRAGLRNALAMWKAGVPAIPTFHLGEPWDVLRGLARDFPKIAIGGCAMKNLSVKNEFAQECMAWAWPCKIHGFGYGSRHSVMSIPFHSVDATNWQVDPCKFGKWRAFGYDKNKLSVRGGKQNLRPEVEWYLDLEAAARHKWAPEMVALAAKPVPPGPVAVPESWGDRREVGPFPCVRLAIGGPPDAVRMGLTPPGGAA